MESITKNKCENYEENYLFKTIAEEYGFIEFKCNISDELKKGNNFLGIISPVEIEGTKFDDTKESLYLITKSAAKEEAIRQRTNTKLLFLKEIFCYEELIPTFHDIQMSIGIDKNELVKTPAYFKSSNVEPNEYIVLEDLSRNGYKMYNKANSLTFDHMEIILKKLALLHALSFVLKSRDPAKFKRFHENCLDSFLRAGPALKFVNLHFIKELNNVIMAVDDQVVADKLIQFFGDDVSFKISNLACKSADDPYSVICHGDCWTNNLLFKLDIEGKPIDMQFIDWQLVRCSSPLSDLYYLIFGCTDEALRKDHFFSFFDIYRKNLENHLKMFSLDAENVYPRRQYEKDKSDYIVFGLFATIISLPFFTAGEEGLNEVLTKNNGKKSVYNDLYRSRINGIVRDCIKHGYL